MEVTIPDLVSFVSILLAAFLLFLSGIGWMIKRSFNLFLILMISLVVFISLTEKILGHYHIFNLELVLGAENYKLVVNLLNILIIILLILLTFGIIKKRDRANTESGMKQ